MSEELQEFYRAYAKWLDDGAPEGFGDGAKLEFTRRYGLCSNLIRFMRKRLKVDWSESMDEVGTELYDQFENAGMCSAYPFGVSNYDRDELSMTQHLNPIRVKWVREHVT